MRVLVCVDLQHDFIDGALGSPEAKNIVQRVVDKINNYPDKGNTLVLFTKDTHDNTYMDTLEGTYLPIPHCIENTPGWSINKEITNAVEKNRFLSYSSDKIIKSRVYKNTFASDDLRKFFERFKNDIEEVEFCGLCSDVCVISNVLMARMVLPEVEITVDKNCCAGITPEKHQAALEVMRSCQINVIGE